MSRSLSAVAAGFALVVLAVVLAPAAEGVSRSPSPVAAGSGAMASSGAASVAPDGFSWG